MIPKSIYRLSCSLYPRRLCSNLGTQLRALILRRCLVACSSHPKTMIQSDCVCKECNAEIVFLAAVQAIVATCQAYQSTSNCAVCALVIQCSFAFIPALLSVEMVLARLRQASGKETQPANGVSCISVLPVMWNEARKHQAALWYLEDSRRRDVRLNYRERGFTRRGKCRAFVR